MSAAQRTRKAQDSDLRVYHFLPARWALDDIAKRRIKISEIDQTNDPFELSCVSQTNRQLREGLRGYKREMNEKFGLLCFSKKWVNPLLWSHYADKHRGICLGFDVDRNVVRKVTYVKDRPPLELPLTTAASDALLWTKYWDWQYEREWRSWFPLNERKGDHYFYPFDSKLQLREVIVGPLCSTTETEVKAALRGDHGRVTVIKARLAFKTFRVVTKKNGFRTRGNRALRNQSRT